MSGQEVTAASEERASVAIIVLNWNGWRFTLECLESLGHLTDRNWYVILVDNGSTDDSVERIRAWARGEVEVKSAFFSGSGWPKPVRLREYEGEPEGDLAGDPPEDRDLVLVRLPENRGFAGGNNVAIRLAVRWGADWTWLLNNDTVVTPECLTEMLKVGEADDRVAVVGCKLLYYDRPNTIQAAGGGRFYFWAGISRNYGAGQGDNGRWDKPFRPHYVSGACMVVRTCAWEEIGLLDENLFFYGEEVDWQMRGYARQWLTSYCPGARVFHRERGTAAQRSAWADFHYTRSNLLVCRKHRPMLFIVAIGATLFRAIRWVAKRHADRGRAILSGVLAALARRSPRFE